MVFNQSAEGANGGASVELIEPKVSSHSPFATAIRASDVGQLLLHQWMPARLKQDELGGCLPTFSVNIAAEIVSFTFQQPVNLYLNGIGFQFKTSKASEQP